MTATLPQVSPRTKAQRPHARIRVGRVLHYIYCSLSYIFLLAPLQAVMGGSFHGGTRYALVGLPTEFSLKWYFEIPASQFSALGLSFMLGAISAVVACVLGIPVALAIVRSNLAAKGLISAYFRAPLQIPTVVTGLAFLQLYFVVGDATGLYVNGTFFGLVLGHVFIATPYVIGTVTSILQRFDNRLEEAALSLGASRWRTFRRVTLPVLMPGVYAGSLYAFVVSFSDVPVSIFLSAPDLITYPVILFHTFENDFTPSSLASATLVIVFTLAVMLFVQRAVGLQTLLRSGSSG